MDFLSEKSEKQRFFYWFFLYSSFRIFPEPVKESKKSRHYTGRCVIAGPLARQFQFLR